MPIEEEDLIVHLALLIKINLNIFKKNLYIPLDPAVTNCIQINADRMVNKNIIFNG